MTVRRFDVVALDGATRTPEGYLEFPRARLTKTGVFEYRRADGSIQRELRLAEHVFDGASIASADGQPLSLAHPSEMISPETFRDQTVGVVLNPRKDDDGVHVTARVRVMDAEAIEAVEAGVRELSNGYEFVPEAIPGGVFQRADVFDGKPIQADVLQTKIRINHVALVARGRAGPTARLDSAGHQTGDDMELKEALSQIAALEKELAESKTKAARVDALDGESTQLKAELKKFQDAEARAQIEKLAGRVFKVLRQDKEDEVAGTKRLVKLGEDGIMRATLAKLAPETNTSEWKSDKLRGAFEVSMAGESRRVDSASEIASVAVAAKAVAATDSNEDKHSSEKAFQQMKANAVNAWKVGQK